MVLHTCPDYAKKFTKTNFSQVVTSSMNTALDAVSGVSTSWAVSTWSAHPTLRLNRNKVWRLPQVPLEMIPHTAPRMPLSDVSNQSSVMVYSPEPAITTHVTYIPSVIVQARTALNSFEFPSIVSSPPWSCSPVFANCVLS